jgi:hypothetical protein
VTGVVVGSTVRWRSQSAGVWKEKQGDVVAAVPAGGEVNDELARWARGKITNPGMPRDHESYVVRAGGRLYWPRVNGLELVAGPGVAP